MSQSYKITTNNLKIEDIIAQLRAIKTYPAIVNIYDRVLKLTNADETHAMIQGLEIGYYIGEDEFHK
jgi:hypothetical protein